MELGAWPGDGRGSVLVTGHTVSSGGGAFDYLGALVVADRIAVTTDAGELSYRVECVEDLDVAELADRSADLLGSAGPERLLLVTCTDFDGRTYRGNTVVVARPDPSPFR